MESQLQLILVSYFIVYLGLTSGQLQNLAVDQAVTSQVTNDVNVQDNIVPKFIWFNRQEGRTENNESYWKILEQEVTNERHAFNTMKEELEMARLADILQKNHSTKNIIAVKRETKKKPSKPSKKNNEKKTEKHPDKQASKRLNKRPSNPKIKHPVKQPPEKTEKPEAYNMWEHIDAEEEKEEEESLGIDEEDIKFGEMNESSQHPGKRTNKHSHENQEHEETHNMWEPMKVKEKEEEPVEINEEDIQFGGTDEHGMGEEGLTEDGKYRPPFADDLPCPVSNRGDTTNDNKTDLQNWEFYYNEDDPLGNDTIENSNRTTLGGITYINMETDDGPATPPYDSGPEGMRTKSDLSGEDDIEYLQSEWRQNWTMKNDDERFEEALQHAKRETLVNWYQHGQEQWAELEEMKKQAALDNCEHSVLSEPIEVVELRLNKALRSIAKYIAKFDYGEATGEKLI